MKITILTTSFPRFEGDFAGTFVYHYARELARSGCGVRVLAPDDPRVDDDKSWQPCEVNRFKYFYPRQWQVLAYGAGMLSRIKQNLAAVLQLPFFLASFGWNALRTARESDLMHAYWSLAGGIALAVKAIRGIPVVINLWGSDRLFMKIPGLSSLYKSFMRRADAIICESDHFRQQLERLGIPANKIFVIPNGIDLERFQPREKTSARAQLSLPSDKTLVLTVGSLSQHKGQNMLIAAIPEILKSETNVHFVIVGEGEIKPRLESLVKSLNLNGHVTFAGLQEASTIPLWLNAADLFVLPSSMEGSPNVILEAMASGLPVIATAVGDIPGMIRNGEDGLLTPAKSAAALAQNIVSLMRDKSLQDRLGKNARESVRKNHNNWETQTARLRKVYESLV